MGKLGRDKNFYRYVDDKNDSAKDIKARVEYGISHSINKTNPYLNYIAFGNYTEDSLPYYLRAENYSHIKKNLDRITLVEGDLTAIKDKNFDFFNLSFFFSGGNEYGAGAADTVAEHFCIERASAYRKKNRALDNLTTLLYGRW